MTNTYNSKTVFITGAAHGIGKELSLAFAKEGAKVIVTDIDTEAGKEVVNKIKDIGQDAEFYPLDVTSKDQIKEVLSSLDQLDILINNAGLAYSESLENLSEEKWDITQDLCLKSVYLCSKYALPLLRRSEVGNIINIASINASSFNPSLPAYSAAKGGVISLTGQLAIEYATQGIRVNAISPGLVITEEAKSQFEADELELEMSVECYPVGRLGKSEDIAHAALFLASEKSGFINGVNLVVDGGMSLIAAGALLKPSLRRKWKDGILIRNNH